ncbi:MAG: thiamine pyrophosphate-dependent enzyme, partial [Pyrinomonadaceae bacterium]
ISKKGPAYDIATEWVDGMDVLAIRSATERAIDRARKEYLPTFLEVRTYRFMGHSMSDPGNYRTRVEIEKYQERDPVKLFLSNLKEKKVIDDQAYSEMDKQVRAEVENAVRIADESPLPEAGELYTDVYAE